MRGGMGSSLAPASKPRLTSRTFKRWTRINDTYRRRRLPARDQHVRPDEGDFRGLPAWRRLAGHDGRRRRIEGDAPHQCRPRRLRRQRRSERLEPHSDDRLRRKSVGARHQGRLRAYREGDGRRYRRRRPARCGLSRSAWRDGDRASRRRRRRDFGARAPRHRQGRSARCQPRPARQRHARDDGTRGRADRLPHLSACRHGRDRPRLRKAPRPAAADQAALCKVVSPIAVPDRDQLAMHQ
ncbi:hypothetical protein ACVWXN_002027 [Bradyrhizobium sp. i1.4.4]